MKVKGVHGKPEDGKPEVAKTKAALAEASAADKPKESDEPAKNENRSAKVSVSGSPTSVLAPPVPTQPSAPTFGAVHLLFVPLCPSRHFFTGGFGAFCA